MKLPEKQDGGYIKHKRKGIHYKDEGEGTTLVLLHGYLESIEIWKGFSESLTEHFRVIRVDLPGHGMSELLAEVQTMKESARALKALADHLELKKFFLLGHSLGGYVTLSFLDSFPEYLTGFCLFHSHPLADTQQTIEKREKEIGFVQSGRKDFLYNVNIPNAFANDNLDRYNEEIEFAKKIARNTSDEGIIATLKGMMIRKNYVDLLANTNIPFLWILGKKDNYIPFTEIQTKVKMPVRGKLLTLKNSGHQGFMEEKQNVVKYLLAFVNRL
ncbi:MAG: alpha/beta fold hydrolase [Bacteroidota bacterium]|nr:alpha/beta fold hydrolase [Bacteroidota bacterium]